MKVACVSPYQVDETAIASVALQFVRCLRERIQIDLLSDPETLPSGRGALGLELLPQTMRGREPVRALPASVEALLNYDVAHFQWGNCPVHIFQYDLCRKLVRLRQRPAILSSIHDVDLRNLMGRRYELSSSVLQLARNYPDFWEATRDDLELFMGRVWLMDVMTWSDLVVVHSEFAKNMLTDLLGSRLPPVPIEVVKLGIDGSKHEVEPEEARKYRSREGMEGKSVFGHVGRLHPPKGVGAIVRAGHYLVEFLGRRDFALFIAGLGPQLPILQQLCAKLIPANHQIVGFADWPVYYSADVMMVPRDVVRGETSLLMPEAFSAGRPVIAPDMGSFSEYVNGDVGYLTAANSDLDYMEAMSFFLDHPEEIERRGENARKFAREELDFRSQADGYLKLYEIALNRRDGA